MDSRLTNAAISLLLVGCATEPRREPPEPVPPPPVVEAAPPAVEAEPAELALRWEEEMERAPGLAPDVAGPDLLEVHFASGEVALDPSARGALDRLAAALGDDAYVDLQGHADATGDAEANRKLAEQRALVVRDYLHRVHGLPLNRMGVVSLGSAAPATDVDSAEGRSRNRRVVIVVLRDP